MEPTTQTMLAQMGADLTTLAVKGTASAVNTKIKTIKAEKDADKIRNYYNEIISELIEERDDVLRIAQAYRQELDKIEISDEDIEHLHGTIETVIDILSKFMDNEGLEAFKAIKDIINVDTLKTMQLLGFNYKDAIGVPLTNLCANAIMNIGSKNKAFNNKNKGKK